MNKLFTKIVGAALGLTMAIGVGVAVASNSEAVPVHAATSPYTWSNITTSNNYGFPTTASTSESAELTDSSHDNLKFKVKNAQANSGYIFLKSSGYFYNTSAIAGKITNVSATFTAGVSTTAKVKIGLGLSSGSSLTGVTKEVTCSANGTISCDAAESAGYSYFSISETSGKKNAQLASITITFVPTAASDTTTALSVSPNAWAGYDSQTINVSNYNVSCTSTKSPGYEFQGIGSGSDDNFVARVADFTSGRPTKDDTRLQWKAKYPTTAGGSTYLYAYVSLTVNADSVNSIAISGSMTKTTYSQGEAWDPTGFTVNAFYASAPSTPVNVTSSVSWAYSPATTASTSTTSVTCTASFGGKSATSSAQAVTVNEKKNIGGIVDGEKYFIISTYGGSERYLKAFDSAPGAPTTSNGAWPGDANMPSEDTDAWTFTSAGSDDTWVITSQAGKTLYATATNNGLGCTSSGNDEWKISEPSSGVYKMQAKNSRYLTVYQTSNWRVYASTTGQGEDSSTIRFVKYEEPVTLDSLTVATPKTSFTVGENFSLGSAVITASYSDGTDVVVPNNDSGLSFKLNNVSITMSTQLSRSNNAQSLVITYTDSSDRTKSATGYAITVDYATVSTISLDYSSITLAKGGSQTLTATVKPANAEQTVTWSTEDSSIVDISSTTGGTITVTASSSNTGTVTITATAVGGKTATCSVTVSGDPVLTMFDEDDTNITFGSITKFTTDSNFYLNVVAENFQGAITYTWSSSNTSVISVDEEADEMCMSVVDGAGSTRISCNAVGATSGNLTVYVDVTVTEPVVTDVTWSAPASLSVYDNAQLTTTNISSWSPVYEKDNGDIGSITSNYVVKLGGETITLSHDWLVSDDGKELWIEYGGVSSEHVSVQVTEYLNTINYSAWTQVTDDSTLKDGDKIVIADSSKNEVMSLSAVKAGETLAVENTIITDGTIADVPSGAAQLTLGGSSGAWTLQNSEGEYLSITTENTRHLQFVESEVTLAISISDGAATISSSSGNSVRILLNTSASPHRFSTYQSAVSASMILPQIYKSSTTDIANTNVNAQRAILSFAKSFNTTLACDAGGNTSNVSGKWNTVSSAFTTTMNGLSEGDKIIFKRLIANASSSQSGDTLQKFLAQYDYIVAKYKLDDFLHDGADRGAVQYARVTPFNIIGNNGNTVAIIVVISMISVTAIGGYFFLRKRKEN